MYSLETALPNALCVQALWILLLSYHVDTLFVISVWKKYITALSVPVLYLKDMCTTLKVMI